MTPQTGTDAQVYLSVISAAYNEAENLPELIKEINEMMDKLDKPCEIVITNDGSKDATLDVLRELMKNFPRLRVLNFPQNVGQTAAWDCALRNARGTYIAALDSDLQNDPADIPMMLEHIESGKADLVNGWRSERNDPWIRLASTKIANGVRNWLTKENVHDSACGLKVFKAECMRNVKMFRGLHRFIPTLVKLEGYTVIEVPVNHRPRTAGVAKYGVWNRVFCALRDTFAIRWMQSRMFHYKFEEIERNTNE